MAQRENQGARWQEAGLRSGLPCCAHCGSVGPGLNPLEPCCLAQRMPRGVPYTYAYHEAAMEALGWSG